MAKKATQASKQPRPTATEVTIRRAPRMSRFLILGGALGAIVTLILTLQFTPDPAVGLPALLAYFELFGVSAGVMLGALVAIILDAVSRRSARHVTAERTVVDSSSAPTSPGAVRKAG